MQNYVEWWVNKRKQFINLSIINQINILHFFQQLSLLTLAGIPLLKSLDILENGQDKPPLKWLIYAIKKEIIAGKSLYESLSYHPQYFDQLICQLIRIGEYTGKLENVLTMITDHLEKNKLIAQRIKQALFYPAMIVSVALLITLSLFLFVVPQFAELFQEVKTQLPTLTRAIFYISYLLKIDGKYLLIFFLFIFLISYFNENFNKKIKHYLFNIFISLPIIKSILKKIYLARFARSLSMTYTAGIAITDAVSLSVRLVKDIEFNRVLIAVRKQINSGLQLHRVMKTFPYFPMLMVQMVKIGEETGQLDHMLYKLADFMEADIDQLIHHANKLLEPLIMMIVGVLIGGLIIGIYLPIFKLGSIV